jgi:hypothetical protein
MLCITLRASLLALGHTSDKSAGFSTLGNLKFIFEASVTPSAHVCFVGMPQVLEIL